MCVLQKDGEMGMLGGTTAAVNMEGDGGYSMIWWLDDDNGGGDGLVTGEIMEKGVRVFLDEIF